MFGYILWGCVSVGLVSEYFSECLLERISKRIPASSEHAHSVSQMSNEAPGIGPRRTGPAQGRLAAGSPGGSLTVFNSRNHGRGDKGVVEGPTKLSACGCGTSSCERREKLSMSCHKRQQTASKIRLLRKKYLYYLHTRVLTIPPKSPHPSVKSYLQCRLPRLPPSCGCPTYARPLSLFA